MEQFLWYLESPIHINCMLYFFCSFSTSGMQMNCVRNVYFILRRIQCVLMYGVYYIMIRNNCFRIEINECQRKLPLQYYEKNQTKTINRNIKAAKLGFRSFFIRSLPLHFHLWNRITNEWYVIAWMNLEATKFIICSLPIGNQTHIKYYFGCSAFLQIIIIIR